MKTHIPFIYLLFFSALAYAQTEQLTSPATVGVSSVKLDEMKDYLHGMVDEGQLAGIQTAIIRKAKIVHFDTYGYADINDKKALDKSSLFRIFSMTKPITSVGLMQLYEKGKFKLNDPVHMYIPEFKNMLVYSDNGNIPLKNSIKIIDLLRHTSGIGYGRSPYESINNLYTKADLHNSKNLEEFISKLSKIPLAFEPGTDWEYGFSTDVCGYLIEILSGEKLDEYLFKNVLQPLGMMDTHFQLPASKLEQFTTGYSTQNEKLIAVEIPSESRFTKEVTFLKGGGGLVSTTNDYLKFCQMLLNKGQFNGNRLLTEKTIDLMTKDHLSDVRKQAKHQLRLLPGETGFGLGFSIADKKEEGVVYGWGGAAGTYFRIDPRNDLAYLLMIQLSPYRHLGLSSRFQELVNKALVENSNANNQSDTHPISLNKTIFSGIGLNKVNLKDQPNRLFFQKALYQGSEISVYVISSETATKYFESFPIDEFVFLMNGKSRLRPKNEESYEFNSGDHIIVNKGYNGDWETIGGNKYHLELSVVSNKRSRQKASQKIKNNPFKIDNDFISGVKININPNGTDKNILFSGSELEITIEAEKPRAVQIQNLENEYFIKILSGLVTITASNGKDYTYHTGDSFILPKGFNGKWYSQGHDLFRTIKVISKIEKQKSNRKGYEFRN